MRSIELVTCALVLLAASSPRAAEVPTSAVEVRPLAVGAAIPDAELRSLDGESLRLHDLVGPKPLVLIFYRGGWWPYCNNQLGELAAAESKLVDLGYEVVALSPDRPEKLAESRAKHKLGFTLLSDSKMSAARAFGIAFRVDDATVLRYKRFKIDLGDASGETHQLLPVPSVFIVDREGVVRFVYSNPDYKVRIDTDALIGAAAEAASK